ncbi:MAG: PD40 domain-containing protein [Saprospirales bacterium]|nr:PD40 domain-containing protein [Saprospirales bacterium]
MSRFVILIFLSLCWLTEGRAQAPERMDTLRPQSKEWLEKGQAALLDHQYEKARRFFLRSVEESPHYLPAKRYLIAANELLGNFQEAAYGSDALLLENPNYSRTLYFEAGRMHFGCGNYSRALDLFAQFKELQQLPASLFGILGETEQENEQKYLDEVEELIQKCRTAQEAAKFSRVDEVVNLGHGINTSGDEYFPCVSNDQTWMFFTSRRNRFSDEDLRISFYAGEWMEGISLPSTFLTSHNEGMSSLVRNGRRMFFTACGRPAVKGTCDLWEAYVEGTTIKKSEPLEGNINSDSWDSQATISCDGTTLYFASNREGGFGGTDIWVSHLLGDGSWEEPQNLGPLVNTPGDEEAPYITNDGRNLFFSSTGHKGLGEQDIFISRLDSAMIHWGEPLNLGPPVNSSYRELGFFLTADGQTGYFASDRSGGYGGMDIYQFQLPNPLGGRPITFVEGQVLDSITWEPLSVTLFTSTKEKVHTDENGRFFMCLPVDTTYSFTIIEPGYAVYYREVRVPIWENRKPYPLSILLQPTQVVHTEEGGIISLSGAPGRQVSHAVFFEFDKADLGGSAVQELDKFLEKLTSDKNIIEEVEIIGYSDQVGSEKYNLVLSENRAKAVAVFLKEKGIKVDRLYIAGSGELMSSIPEAEKRKVEIVVHLK